MVEDRHGTAKHVIHIADDQAVVHISAAIAFVIGFVMDVGRVDHKGILTANQTHVVDNHVIAISTQCHGGVIACVNGIEQGVTDGQVLQLQAVAL